MAPIVYRFKAVVEFTSPLSEAAILMRINDLLVPEIDAKINQRLGPHIDGLTIVKKIKLQSINGVVNGFEAFEDMMDKAISPPDQVISPATDTFWVYHLENLDSDALIEYYESLYCKEGGKYYGKPESLERYHGATDSATVCMVPEEGNE